MADVKATFTSDGTEVRLSHRDPRHVLGDREAARSFRTLQTTLKEHRLRVGLSPLTPLYLAELKFPEQVWGDRAIRALVQACVVGCVRVAEIDLQKNRIGDAGAQALGVLVESSIKPGIHSLNLANNFISPFGVGLLLRSATLSQNYPIIRKDEVGGGMAPLWLRVDKQQRPWPMLTGVSEEKQLIQAENLIEAKSKKLLKIYQAMGRLSTNEPPKHLRILCVPDVPAFTRRKTDDHREPDASIGFCSKKTCRYGSAYGPVAHLPFFWMQNGCADALPEEAALHKQDRDWCKWRPFVVKSISSRGCHAAANDIPKQTATPLESAPQHGGWSSTWPSSSAQQVSGTSGADDGQLEDDVASRIVGTSSTAGSQDNKAKAAPVARMRILPGGGCVLMPAREGAKSSATPPPSQSVEKTTSQASAPRRVAPPPRAAVQDQELQTPSPGVTQGDAAHNLPRAIPYLNKPKPVSASPPAAPPAAARVRDDAKETGNSGDVAPFVFRWNSSASSCKKEADATTGEMQSSDSDSSSPSDSSQGSSQEDSEEEKGDEGKEEQPENDEECVGCEEGTESEFDSDEGEQRKAPCEIEKETQEELRNDSDLKRPRNGISEQTSCKDDNPSQPMGSTAQLADGWDESDVEWDIPFQCEPFAKKLRTDVPDVVDLDD